MRCETILNFPAEHFEINIPTFFLTRMTLNSLSRSINLRPLDFRIELEMIWK